MLTAVIIGVLKLAIKAGAFSVIFKLDIDADRELILLGTINAACGLLGSAPSCVTLSLPFDVSLRKRDESSPSIHIEVHPSECSPHLSNTHAHENTPTGAAASTGRFRTQTLRTSLVDRRKGAGWCTARASRASG
jgi:hypothetical protein